MDSCLSKVPGRWGSSHCSRPARTTKAGSPAVRTEGEGTASREAAPTFARAPGKGSRAEPALRQEGARLGELLRFVPGGGRRSERLRGPAPSALGPSISCRNRCGTRASERLRSQKTSHASCPLRPLVGVPRDLPKGRWEPLRPL